MADKSPEERTFLENTYLGDIVQGMRRMMPQEHTVTRPGSLRRFRPRGPLAMRYTPALELDEDLIEHEKNYSNIVPKSQAAQMQSYGRYMKRLEEIQRHRNKAELDLQKLRKGASF